MKSKPTGWSAIAGVPPGRLFFCVGEKILLTAMATLTRPLQVVKHGINLWRKSRLNGAFVEAQASLGERMYHPGNNNPYTN